MHRAQLHLIACSWVCVASDLACSNGVAGVCRCRLLLSTVAVAGSVLDLLLLGLFRLHTLHICSHHDATTRSQAGQKSKNPTGKMIMSDRLC